MPEHFHLLITEPEKGDPSVVMKVVKQRFARRFNRTRRKAVVAQMALWDSDSDRVWQKRFYDFNAWSELKHVEKLRYMHRNPVKRGLVERPEQWKWSSFRAYLYRETGAVRVNCQEWVLEVKRRPVEKFDGGSRTPRPLICKKRE
ncbi:MAG: transposase [Terriglobales bacterium]